MGAPVGVQVVAQQQPAVETCQPVGDGRHLGEQVDPGPPDEAVGGPGRGRDEQATGPAPRGRQHAFPDRRDGQVDRRHRGAPPEQRAERPHLGPGAEDGDRVPVQPEPLGVGRDSAHRVGGRRLDHTAPDPLVELAAQVAADQPPAAIGQRELGDPLPVTTDLDGVEGPGGRGVGQRRERTVLACVVHDHHPVVDSSEPRGRHRPPRLRCRDPGLDEPPEVAQVAAAPGRLLLDAQRAHRVDRAQRVGDDGAADRAGAALGRTVGAVGAVGRGRAGKETPWVTRRSPRGRARCRSGCASSRGRRGRARRVSARPRPARRSP